MDDQSYQQVMQLIQAMQGGYPASGGPAPYSRGSEIYRGIAAPGSMWQQGRDLLGPFIGQAFGNMNNPINMPHISPGAGIGESIMMDRVASRQWKMVQDQSLYFMAQGFSHDVQRLSERLRVPQMLGMDTARVNDVLAGGAGTQAARLLTGQIAQLPGMDTLMGGNPMAAYESLFANRHLFGGVRGMPAGPRDREAQSRILDAGTEVSKSLMMGIRGTDDRKGFGVLPRLDYTRGFRDQDIFRMAIEAQAGGKWGDLGNSLNQGLAIDIQQGAAAGMDVGKIQRGELEGPNRIRGRILDQVKQDTGEYAKMFEALGDIMGSRDMDQLMSTLNDFTAGKWPTLNAETITSQLRIMEAQAQVLNVSKQEMVATVANVQRTLQGAGGVTATQIAMGLGGGGTASLGASIDMARHVYAISDATGMKSPQDIQRITAQQTGLAAMGLQSSAGKNLTLLEYLRQTNAIDSDYYGRARDTLISGSIGERTSMVNDVMTRAFGSAAEGRKYMDDPNYMRMLREALSDDSGLRVQQGIREGQSYEWRDRVELAGRRRTQRATKQLLSESGLRNAADPEALAMTQMEDTVSYLNSIGQTAGATSVQEVFDKAILAKNQGGLGLTKREAFGRVTSYMQRSSVLKDFVGTVKDRTDKIATAVNFDAMQSADPAVAAGYQASLRAANPNMPQSDIDQMAAALGTRGGTAGLAKTILDEMGAVGSFKSADDRKKLGAIRKLIESDPLAAMNQATEMYKNATPAQLTDANKGVIDQAVGKYQGNIVDRMATYGATGMAWSRGMRGRDRGLSQATIEKSQKQLTTYLGELQQGLSSDDPNVRQAARDNFAQDLLRETDVRNMFTAEEQQYYDKLGATGDAGMVGLELKRQGKINFADINRGYNASAGRGINALDWQGAMTDQERSKLSSGRIVGLTAAQALFNQTMADQNPGLRANMGQLGLSWAEGNIDFQTMFGIQEGAPDLSKINPELAKRWNKFRETTGIDGISGQVSAGVGKVESGIDAMNAARVKSGADTKQAARIDALRDALTDAGEAGTLTDTAAVDKIVGAYGDVTGLDGISAAATGLGAGYIELTGANTAFKKGLKTAHDADPKVIEEVNREASIQKRRRARQDAVMLRNVGAEGLADLELMQPTELSSEAQKALDVLVPRKPRSGWFNFGGGNSSQEQMREASRMFGDRGSVEALDEQKRAAAGTLANFMHKKQLDELGTGGDGRGKGEPIQVTGIITLIDQATGERRTGTVQLSQ